MPLGCRCVHMGARGAEGCGLVGVGACVAAPTFTPGRGIGTCSLLRITLRRQCLDTSPLKQGIAQMAASFQAWEGLVCLVLASEQGPLFFFFSLQVPDILGTIMMHMPAMQEGCMKSCLLEAVASLAGFHIEAVTSSLLCRPLPMDRYLPLPTSCTEGHADPTACKSP